MRKCSAPRVSSPSWMRSCTRRTARPPIAFDLTKAAVDFRKLRRQLRDLQLEPDDALWTCDLTARPLGHGLGKGFVRRPPTGLRRQR